MKAIADQGGVIAYDPTDPRIQEILAGNPARRLGDITNDMKGAMGPLEEGDFSVVDTIMAKDMPELRLLLPVLTSEKGTEDSTVFVRGFYDNLDDFLMRVGTRGFKSSARSLKKMCFCLDRFAASLSA